MNLLKKYCSVLTALTLTVCSISVTTVFCETIETQTDAQYYTLSFEFDGGILDPDGDAVETDFEAVTLKANSSTIIPDGELEKDGYLFSGWTYNNYVMYESGDAFLMPESDVVLVPVWVNVKDPTIYNITYDDEGFESMDTFKETSGLAGQKAVITNNVLLRDGYLNQGWQLDDYIFQKGDKMIIPNHDVVLSPVWFQNHNIYYEAGDVDNVVGGDVITFEKTTSQKFELANSSRLARSGYTLVGWTCDVDGKDYVTEQTFTMPDCDVHFTAIWKPLTYDITFAMSSSKKFTISGTYGESLTLPECEFTKSGYVFAGWTYNGEVYQAGDEFEIPALLKGQKIVFGCKWEDASTLTYVNCFSLIEAKRQYADGNISADELQEQADFILGN